MTPAQYQELFYRCRFSELLNHLTQRELDGEVLGPELSMLKANSEFERHRVSDAKATLQKLAEQKDTAQDKEFDEFYHYALARLNYFDGKTEAAHDLFREIYQATDDPNHKFKALLGIANTYYSRAQWARLPPMIEQLKAFEPLKKQDEHLSLLIFFGNYFFASRLDVPLARNYFKKALAAAARQSWTYFIARSLYGLAGICEFEGKTEELLWTLGVLTSFVDESEQLFFSYVVNERFKNHFSIDTSLEFDTAHQRILIKNKWESFRERPLLFSFLLLLHTSGTFINKEIIAQQLWPSETYRPLLHDPRIFDIAKRARQLIEAYEHQPVVLLSGRMGYKLAST